jgi:hypothetical protein
MNKPVPMRVQSALGRFKAARTNLEEFRRANARLVEEYDLLRDAYNSTLDHVKAVYRDNYDVVGSKLEEFKARTRTEIDAQKLLDLMGPAADPMVTVRYAVDREVYRQAVEKGLVPSDVIEQVETEGSPAIYGPKPL